MKLKTLFALLISFVLLSTTLMSQDKNLEQTILQQDSLFWTAYNTCDIDKITSFLTNDLEFYHDKAGLTNGLAQFTESVKKGLCSNPNSLLRREAIKGTVQVYPLSNFGAILSGEHVFYRNKKGTSEYPEEAAKFTHIWKHENGKWKMSRVLSYDHQAVPYHNNKIAITLDEEILDLYSGNYSGPQTKKVTITNKDGLLEMLAGPMQMTLYPQSRRYFFHKESSLTFEFIKSSEGKVLKLVVRENGAIVEEARRINQ